MKLFIPELGTILKLSVPWTFNLYDESRNDSLVDNLGRVKYDTYDQKIPAYEKAGWSCLYHETKFANDKWLKAVFKPVTIPQGTTLTVDRIYVRKGCDEYSSLSFFLNRKSVDPTHSPFAKRIHAGKGKCRFWAKLEDVNNIVFEEIK